MTWAAILLAGIAPVVALFLLRLGGVPLGQPGKFTYLYSELVRARQRGLPTALMLAAAAAWGVWRLGGANRAWGGLGVLAAAMVGLAAWAYVSPPVHVSQHVFNFQSPAQDGAFLTEARRVRDVRAYLANFPRRAATPPAEMRGTRVTSNPPGATLLALAAIASLDASAPLRRAARASMREEGLSAEYERHAGQALVFAWLLLALWALALPALYLAGREYLPRATAAAFAVCSGAGAMPLLFLPGKDPAQLLTVGLLLWLWLRAVRRDSVALALLGGVALAGGCLLSLVHVWVAAILVVAVGAAAVREPGMLRRRLLRQVLPGAAGVIVGGVLMYVAGRIDLLATARAVSAAQAAVTRTGPEAMPLAWQLVGVPLFLLFCGPAVWCAVLAATRRRVEGVATAGEGARMARLGAWLLACTGLVMLGTIGFTNAETPRLWIPFVPLLLLGAALCVPATGVPASRGVLALLVFAQVLSAALQWTMMDVREAEMRLVLPPPAAAPRLFD